MSTFFIYYIFKNKYHLLKWNFSILGILFAFSIRQNLKGRALLKENIIAI